MDALIERRIYGHYVIEVIADNHGDLPGGPLENFEHGISAYMTDNLARHERPNLPDLTREQIRAHLPALCKALGEAEYPARSPATLFEALAPWWDRRYDYANVTDYINDVLHDIYTNESSYADVIGIATAVFTAADYTVADVIVSDGGESVCVWGAVSPANVAAYFPGDADVTRHIETTLREHGLWAIGSVFTLAAVDPDGEVIDSLGGIIDEYNGEYLAAYVAEFERAIADAAAEKICSMRALWHDLRRAVREVGNADRPTSHVLRTNRDAARAAIVDAVDALRVIRNGTADVEGA